uniref:Uncharacterized protein n=1 Tax=Trypanosoma vivax (strain Y486) TaxID=1055687 RepID=G0U1T0_TRYVY|nr:conserved hypothetical protein [Trypanosoma vivax Y486]
MFNSQQIISSLAWNAPHFLIRQFPSVFLGLVIGYCSVLLFLGPLSFIHSLAQITITLVIAAELVVLVRAGVAYGVEKLEPTELGAEGGMGSSGGTPVGGVMELD